MVRRMKDIAYAIGILMISIPLVISVGMLGYAVAEDIVRKLKTDSEYRRDVIRACLIMLYTIIALVLIGYAEV